MTYDPNNIFARILRGEIPCKKIYEDEYALAFYDIHPLAKIHALLIPKGAYVSAEDFSKMASGDEIVGFMRAISHVTSILDIKDAGYRLIANTGLDGQAEVPHFHIHILGGQSMGRIVNLP